MFSLPNLLTLTNLACGAMAIKYWLEGDYHFAAVLVFVALIADFLDGFAARALKISGEFGKQLDSLADMVTFGLLPGVVVFSMLENSGWSWLALIIPLFSALRLAKFNLDTRQTDSFLGLATPANGLFWIGWGYFYFLNKGAVEVLGGQALIDVLINPWVISTAAIATSVLLITDIPMFSLKIKSLDWKSNKVRYVFITLSLLAAFLGFMAAWSLFSVTIVILLYLVLSMVNNLVHTKK